MADDRDDPSSSASKAKTTVLEKATAVLNRPVGGDFTPVNDPEKRQALLRSAAHARQPSVLWTKDRRLLKRFFVRRYDERLGVLECEFTGRASKVLEEVDRELDQLGSSEIFFNVRCEDSTLFFRLYRPEVKSRQGMLQLQSPKQVFEVQRRAQLRTRVSEIDGFRVDSALFRNGPREMQLLDLSAGGIGLELVFADARSRDSFTCPSGSRGNVSLDLIDLSLSLEGEVLYMKPYERPLDGAPCLRSGLRFVGMKADISEALQLFVLERNYDRLKTMFDGA